MKKNAVLGSLLCCLSLGVSGCLTLTPIRAVQRVALTPVASEEYQVDPVDSSLVFAKEGLRVKVQHLSDQGLNAQIPDSENPYTHGSGVDVVRGFVPVRFTVFQVTVSNPTFDKVLLQPERTVLVTDRGKVLPAYLLTRADAQGSVHNFETYWLSQGVQSGNAQKQYLERMSVLRGGVYHRDSFVFKGGDYTGKVVFDPLPRDTRSVTLRIQDFVLEFGIYDVPRSQLDLEFPFTVREEVVEPAPAVQAAGAARPQ